MWEVFKSNPQQLTPVLIIAAICLAVVVGTAIKAWRKNEVNKRETELKMEMVAHGMSADDIIRVLNAKTTDSTDAETTDQKKA